MAYTQNPGRSPLLKTGSGIPSALLQTKPNEELIQIADEETLQKAWLAMDKGKFNDKYLGVSGDTKTGKFTANPYEKKYVKAPKNTLVKDRVEEDGKTIKRSGSEYAKSNSGSVNYDYRNNKEQTPGDFRKGFVSDSTATMNKRNERVKELELQYKQTQDYKKYADIISKKMNEKKPNQAPKKPAPRQMKNAPLKQTKYASKEPGMSAPKKSKSLMAEENLAAKKAEYKKFEDSQKSKTPAKMKKC
jgi:hypothetical protein